MPTRCFERFRPGIQPTQEEGYRFVSIGETESAKGYREDSSSESDSARSISERIQCMECVARYQGQGAPSARSYTDHHCR